MRFAIIGCGEAGNRRAAAIALARGAEVAVCVDAVAERAEQLAAAHAARATTDWRTAIASDDVDAVVIATTNNTHAPIGIGAAEAGKHILCERPLARNPSEAEQMVAAARENNVRLKTGFSLRYNPVVVKAREIIDQGRIGRIVFLRGRTGRGSYAARPPDWVVDFELSGGGTLLDNGMDLLDLCRFVIGDFQWVQGYSATLVWPIEPCEDNAFAVLTTADGRAALIHSSWADWQGYLSLDISGTDGYIRLDLDNAVVTLGSRPGTAGAGLEEAMDLSREPDRSLSTEVEELVSAIAEGREPLGGGHDGLEALVLAHAIYRSSDEKAAIRV